MLHRLKLHLVLTIMTLFINNKASFADQNHIDLVDAFTVRSKQDRDQYKTMVDDAEHAFYSHKTRLGQDQTKVNQTQNQILINQILGTNNLVNDDNVQEILKDQNILIFVSFSMPKKLLWSYFEQAKLYNAKLVMRGLVNNSFKDTVKSMDIGDNKILRLEVNPKLFKAYQVKRVPTIVVKNNNGHDRFVGSVTLAYILNEINSSNRIIR